MQKDSHRTNQVNIKYLHIVGGATKVVPKIQRVTIRSRLLCFMDKARDQQDYSNSFICRGHLKLAKLASKLNYTRLKSLPQASTNIIRCFPPFSVLCPELMFNSELFNDRHYS